jgi:hypothetical protein
MRKRPIYKSIKCVDCGAKVEPNSSRHKRCVSCGIKHNKQRAINYRKVNKYELSVATKAWRKLRHSFGLCVNCPNKARKGKVHCLKCHKKSLVRQKQYRKKNPDAVARLHRSRVYGITSDQYESVLLKQDNKCAICKRSFISFIRCPDTDHSHTTKKFRGILCHKCNIGLSYVEDSDFLEKAKIYLQETENVGF